MNLRKKKELAARILKVGKERIIFSQQRLNEIKEAITKQDIRDLKRDGAITVREISGRRKNVNKRKSRGPGKVKKRVNKRKRDYIVLTRKLRAHIKDLRNRGKIQQDKTDNLRKKIRNKISLVGLPVFKKAPATYR